MRAASCGPQRISAKCFRRAPSRLRPAAAPAPAWFPMAGRVAEDAPAPWGAPARQSSKHDPPPWLPAARAPGTHKGYTRHRMTVEPTEVRRVSKRSSSTSRDDLWTLAAVAIALVLSRVIEPSGPNAPLRLVNRTLPGVCLVRRATGRPCPSCGLTRGVLYLFRLDYAKSKRANPLAPIVVALGLWKVTGASRRCWLRVRGSLLEKGRTRLRGEGLLLPTTAFLRSETGPGVTSYRARRPSRR